MPDAEGIFDPAQFWQFSLGHYAQAGVQPACLSLQDNYRGNVNLALLLHWLDGQHYRLPDLQIQELEKSLGETERLLGQYRAMRRQLKPRLDNNGYQSLLQFELELEKQQQHALIAQLNRCCDPRSPQQIPTDNLRRYCHHLGAITILPALQGHKQ